MIPKLNLEHVTGMSSFRRRGRRTRRIVLAGLVLSALLLNYLSFFTPSAVQAQASDPSIEQQINIVDQEYSYSATANAYNPTDESLGLIRWDSTKYNGGGTYTERLSFEAIVKGSQTSQIAYASLYTASDVEEVEAAVTNTGARTVDEFTAAAVGEDTSLVLDSNGYPVISYYDSTNADLLLMHCNDVHCESGDETVSSVDPDTSEGRYTSLRLDSSGNPIISYRDGGTADDLKVAFCNDANCAGGDEIIVRVDSTGDTGYYTSLQLDQTSSNCNATPKNCPVVAYYQGTTDGTCSSTGECALKLARFYRL